MPTVTPALVRKQIAEGKLDPIYLIVGDDDAEMTHLAAALSEIVEDELRAFNVERIYATDKLAAASGSIVESAKLLPMMSPRRVVIVLRAEKLLRPKRRGKSDDGPEEEGAIGTNGGTELLESYVKSPEPQTVLVFIASDVDRSRRLYKALQKQATIVECWGLKSGRDARVDLRQAARQAEQLVRQAVADAGQQIDTPALKLIAERAGTDIGTLRGDVDRLLLYAAGKSRITIDDAREVVSAESSQDDWAVTNAIQRGDAAEALRQLALSLDAGGIPYKILGQLAWFVREKLPFADSPRVRPAIEALLRTDLDLKTSGGDARVLLERLVVELCGPASPAKASRLLERPAT